PRPRAGQSRIPFDPRRGLCSRVHVQPGTRPASHQGMRMYLLVCLTACLDTSLGADMPGDPGQQPGAPSDPGSPAVPVGGYALASSDHGLAYLLDVIVGGQTFALDVDTG